METKISKAISDLYPGKNKTRPITEDLIKKISVLKEKFVFDYGTIIAIYGTVYIESGYKDGEIYINCLPPDKILKIEDK